MTLESGNRQPVHHAEDDAGSDEVREKTDSRMAEGRAHDELHPDGSDSQHGKRGEAGANIRTNDCGRRLHPALTGEEGNANHDAEESLGEGGVGGGDRRRQVEKDGKSSEYALRNHRAQSAPAKDAHPAALIHLLGPDGDADGEQADELSQHAMTVFELYTSDQRRNPVERAERGGPIRYGESSIVAGHQGSGDDQQKNAGGCQHGEAMVRAMIGSAWYVRGLRHEFQRARLLVYDSQTRRNIVPANVPF